MSTDDSSSSPSSPPEANPPSPAPPAEDDEVTIRDGLRVLGSWPWHRRITFVLATAFTIFHISVVLLRGSPKQYREKLPKMAFWAEGLRMTDTWGMFSLPPKDKLVSVVGITADGKRIEISHVQQNERNFVQRVVDTRLRKIQTKLADEKSRSHWGWGYVKYFCQDALARGVPLDRIQLEVVPEDGKPAEIYLKQGCRPARKATGGRP